MEEERAASAEGALSLGGLRAVGEGSQGERSGLGTARGVFKEVRNLFESYREGAHRKNDSYSNARREYTKRRSVRSVESVKIL